MSSAYSPGAPNDSLVLLTYTAERWNGTRRKAGNEGAGLAGTNPGTEQNGGANGSARKPGFNPGHGRPEREVKVGPGGHLWARIYCFGPLWSLNRDLFYPRDLAINLGGLKKWAHLWGKWGVGARCTHRVF